MSIFSFSPMTLMIFRVVWVSIRIVLAIWMARSGIQFYYQGF